MFSPIVVIYEYHFNHHKIYTEVVRLKKSNQEH